MKIKLICAIIILSMSNCASQSIRKKSCEENLKQIESERIQRRNAFIVQADAGDISNELLFLHITSDLERTTKLKAYCDQLK